MNFKGTNGNNTITGTNGKDIIRGLGGDDSLRGGRGDDTIRYDRGGVDAVTVDLGAGSATGNWHGVAFTDKLRSIENVRGSREGSDALRGSARDNRIEGKGGDDTLAGRGGDDRLDGGAGNDVFVFANKGGSDTILDFDASSNGEKIDLGAVTRIKGFTDLKKNHMSQDGDDVIITDNAGTEITLLDVGIGDLHKADFLF